MDKHVAVDCLSPEVARGILTDCLEHGNIIQSRHFREELGAEGLCFEDAWHVMRSGTITEPGEQDPKTGEWTYKVEGYETGEKYLVIVFTFKQVDTALLVTVYSLESRRRIV